MKYGFVYIWYDKKHKRFYIGSHWGTEDDGYVCGSSWMLQAYKIRQNDFKRRILTLVYTNRSDLFEEEQRWLDMIPREEFGKQYYNRNPSILSCTGRWWLNEETRKETGERLSLSIKKLWEKAEYRKMMSEARRESEKLPERRKKRSEVAKKLWMDPKYKEKRSEARKELWKNSEFRKKTSTAIKKSHEDTEYRSKVSKTMKKFWNDPEYRKKMKIARWENRKRMDANT